MVLKKTIRDMSTDEAENEKVLEQKYARRNDYRGGKMKNHFKILFSP